MITDFALLDQLLGAIQSTSPMAVLHREHEIAEHEVRSDVDLCVAADPLSVISRVVADLEKSGALLILIFHYDRGSYSFFFSNPQGTGGAQVDVLHDPTGFGRYGIRTDQLLGRKTLGARWPRVDELDEALYVLRKRQVKADIQRIAGARRDVMGFGKSRANQRAHELFSRQEASNLIGLSVSERGQLHASTAIWRSRLMRPSRILRRCGFLAHVLGDPAPSVARCLAERMNRLITSSAATDPGARFLVRHLWRPRLVVSVGAAGVWPRPDAVLDAASDPLDDLCSTLVSSMHSRVIRTYKLNGHQ